MSTGIDKAINQVQDVLTNDVWQLPSRQVVHHGKSFRQNKAYGNDTKLIAMVFEESSKDYVDVMFEDTKDVMTFIDLGDSITGVNGVSQPSREARLIVSINLKTMYPNTGNKMPELAYEEIILAINTELKGTFEIDEIIVGKDAYGKLHNKDIKRFNTYPYHLFAVKGQIKYFYNNC